MFSVSERRWVWAEGVSQQVAADSFIGQVFCDGVMSGKVLVRSVMHSAWTRLVLKSGCSAWTESIEMPSMRLPVRSTARETGLSTSPVNTLAACLCARR
jgi:hypothetical protein